VVSTYGENRNALYLDDVSQAVLVIRAHCDYADHLISMLWSIQSIQFGSSLRIIIIPTEQGCRKVLEKKIIQGGIYFTSLKTNLLDIPDWMYEQSTVYFRNLCSDFLQSPLSNQYNADDKDRFCTINSALHYLLVDIVIEYLKHSCTDCKSLVVTNADNYHAPAYFNKLLKASFDREYQFDITMTNMVWKGSAQYVQPHRGQADLGTFFVSLPFLRRTGINFLNALPSNPTVHDYHDADGIFIDELFFQRGRVKIDEDFLFAHN